MVPQTFTDGYLETMETDKNPFAIPPQAWHPRTKSLGICEYEKGLLAYCQLPHLEAIHHHRPPSTSRLHLLFGLLSKGQWRKLRNRRVLNGMHGGVEGKRELIPFLLSDSRQEDARISIKFLFFELKYGGEFV